MLQMVLNNSKILTIDYRDIKAKLDGWVLHSRQLREHKSSRIFIIQCKFSSSTIQWFSIWIGIGWRCPDRGSKLRRCIPPGREHTDACRPSWAECRQGCSRRRWRRRWMNTRSKGSCFERRSLRIQWSSSTRRASAIKVEGSKHCTRIFFSKGLLLGS